MKYSRLTEISKDVLNLKIAKARVEGQEYATLSLEKLSLEEKHSVVEHYNNEQYLGVMDLHNLTIYLERSDLVN